MNGASLANAVWFGSGPVARMARTLLTPAELMFAAGVRRRNARFDAHPPASTSLPALSVGNLTVGGTGKSPVSAWFVRQLAGKGGRPAVVLRGHGDDEWREHALVNPRAPVVVAADRVSGLTVARTRGADCAVLDDAFQHRQVTRIVDVVLLSADAFTPRARMLPAGPYREPLSALGRADVIVVTARDAAPVRVDLALEACRRYTRAEQVAVMRIVLHELRLVASLPEAGRYTMTADESVSASTSLRARSASSAPGRDAIRKPLSWLAGRSVHVVSAIANPDAFEAQLVAAGARITAHSRWEDHHAYTLADAARIARAGEGADAIVCTLKDAVKLRSCWPRGAPALWYVSQTVVVDRGAEVLDRAVARVLTARTSTALTAG